MHVYFSTNIHLIVINTWYGVSICTRFSTPVLQQVSTNWYHCEIIEIADLCIWGLATASCFFYTDYTGDLPEHWLDFTGDAILKLLEGTCCWLCYWHWLNMVGVASLLLSIWSGEYHSAFVHYCCNHVIKSVCEVKGTLMVIFYKYQLTYF